MPAKKKPIKKMFAVPVIIEINGSITVEAASQEEAIDLAKEEYDRRWTEKMDGRSFGGLALNLIDGPDVQVEFACGEDPEAVEEVEDE